MIKTVYLIFFKLFFLTYLLYSNQNEFELFSFSKNKIVTIAILSDLEGDKEEIKKVKTKLQKIHNLSSIIIAGDLYENEVLRIYPQFPYLRQNVKEMAENLTPFLDLNLPVFVIAGNHEEKYVYETAISQLKKAGYSNIIDINRSALDFEGINIVGLGGYHIPEVTCPGGFLIEDEDYSNAFKAIESFQSQNEITLFITHGPPLTRSSILDYIDGFGHIGDRQLSYILNHKEFKNIYHFHGHLHEASGLSAKFSSGISLNASSVTSYKKPNDGVAGLIFSLKKNGDVSINSLY